MQRQFCRLSGLIASAAMMTSCWMMSFTVAAQAVVSPPPSGYLWRPVKVGGGGFVTSLEFSATGRPYVGTDVYGMYQWTGVQWRQLVTSFSLPPEDVRPEKPVGVAAFALAPSDPGRVYMSFDGRIYRSLDAGRTWRRTSFAPVRMDANDAWRTFGPRMAVDPRVRDVVYAGTSNDGLFVSSDGGARWTRVATVPPGVDERTGDGTRGPGVNIVVFDRSSPIVNGRTSVIFAASSGNGVYRSGDAGDTWQRLDGGPGGTTVKNASVSGGILYLSTGSGVWKYTDRWTEISPTREDYTGLAVDPRDPRYLYAFREGGAIYQSVDGGGRWRQLAFRMAAAGTDVPWHASKEAGFVVAARLMFDPRQSGRLWLVDGIGVWYADVTRDSTEVAFVGMSRGIEELVPTDLVVPPGGRPVLGAMDFPIFHIEDPLAFPGKAEVAGRQSSAWSLDWSGGTPSFLVASVADHRAMWGCAYWCTVDGRSIQSGYSADGGRTWRVFERFPAPAYDAADGKAKAYLWGYGNIAVSASNTDRIVWMPSFNRQMYRTEDRGRNWLPIILPGAAADQQASHFAFYLNRRVLASDKVLPDTFYLAHSLYGVYRSQDGGANWSLVHSGEITPYSIYNAILKTVPGRAGHLYFTPGGLDGLDAPFLRSTDGGATWRNVPDVTRVNAFGFGRGFDLNGYPTLFIAGKVKGQYGIWRSIDEGATWMRINTYPLGLMATVFSIDGSKEVFGEVYLSFGGSGWAYGTLR